MIGVTSLGKTCSLLTGNHTQHVITVDDVGSCSLYILVCKCVATCALYELMRHSYKAQSPK